MIRLRYQSFLVRLWSAAANATGTPAGWQGEIEHIQSRRRWTFDNLDELIEVLRRQAMHPAEVQMESEQ